MAPSNLGLRPLRPGHVPGTWRAPQVLLDAGLETSICPASHVTLDRPIYDPDAVEGSRLRNAFEMRRFNLALAEVVARVMSDDRLPVVIGGDCSILLGCLAGARQHGPLSLLHVDGHSDFRHPGNYDPNSMLGSVAGMDLALATGRGEAIMTDWPAVSGPLVEDCYVIQVGERGVHDDDWQWPDVLQTEIDVIDVFDALSRGAVATQAKIADRLMHFEDRPVWIHLDADVMDQIVMPAVDSPGSPGLSPEFVAHILHETMQTQTCTGLTVSCFDPDRDPSGDAAKVITGILKAVFS